MNGTIPSDTIGGGLPENILRGKVMTFESVTGMSREAYEAARAESEAARKEEKERAGKDPYNHGGGDALDADDTLCRELGDL